MGAACRCEHVPGPHCIAVVGATGHQGGAVVHALVAKGVSVVAITRNPNSKKAQELATLRRVELRKGDLNNQKSLEAAFSGCDGEFVLGTDNRTTGHWKYENMKKQYENCAAALKCIDGMKHVVISATEFLPAQEVFNGKGLPITYVHTGLNVVNANFVLKLGDDGHYSFPLPAGDGPIAWTVMKDLGHMAASVFQRPSMIGQTVGCASFHCTAEQLANHMSKAIGIKINCLKLPAFIWEKVCADVPANFAEIANFCQFFGNQEAKDHILATRHINICRELAGGKLADPVEELRDMHQGVSQAGNFKFRRVIGVLGASGKQGLAVVRSLSQFGKHSVIALVRDDRSSVAQELAKMPRVEVRKIQDMTHGGHEGAMEAFKGCDAAFVNAADPKDPGKVVVMHQKIAAGLTQLGTMKHVVMSTMEEVKKHPKMADVPVIPIEQYDLAPNDMKAPMLDAKANAQQRFFANKPALPTTFVYPSPYIEQGLIWPSGKKDPVVFEWPLGDGPIPWTVLKDFGQVVAGIFDDPSMIGKDIGHASFHCSAKELAKHMSTATGKEFVYQPLDYETWMAGPGKAHPLLAGFINSCKFLVEAKDDVLALRDLKRCEQLGGRRTEPVLAFKQSSPI